MNFSVASAAKIFAAKYIDDENLLYPVVTADNDEATSKINSEIRSEMDRFLSNLDEIASDSFELNAFATSYEIPCNYEHGILSIIINQYTSYKNSAHPSIYKRTLNFNTNNGKRLYAELLSELGSGEKNCPYSPENVNRKLKEYIKQNDIKLFESFEGIARTPEEFYFDENLHVHFIFQQGEIAPYAVGVIDIDATPKLRG